MSYINKGNGQKSDGPLAPRRNLFPNSHRAGWKTHTWTPVYLEHACRHIVSSRSKGLSPDHCLQDFSMALSALSRLGHWVLSGEQQLFDKVTQARRCGKGSCLQTWLSPVQIASPQNLWGSPESDYSWFWCPVTRSWLEGSCHEHHG